jgi:hypothetical protein
MTGSVSLNIFQLNIIKIEARHCSDFSGDIKHTAHLMQHLKFCMKLNLERIKLSEEKGE